MKPRHIVRRLSLLALLLGGVLRLALAAESEAVVTDTRDLTSAAVGLNFDTVFETYIGPVTIIKADESLAEETDVSVPQEKLELQLSPDPNLSIERIRTLRASGALELAESLLVAGLAARADKDDWFDWQRELWEIRAGNAQFERLIEGLVSLAEEVEGEQRLEVLEQLVQARQSIGDLVEARSGLRELLLVLGNDPVRTARLRRLLIDNYLESGLLADAEAASVRYQDEYLPDDTGWNLLRARILIENSEPSKAVVQLVGLQDQKARLMLTLARMREGSLQPAAVITNLEGGGIQISDSRGLERLRVAIIAEAARNSNQSETLVKSLEILLAGGNYRLPMFPEVTSEVLLAAYLELASNVGNDAHLLMGSNSDWLLYASALGKKDAISARAIFVLVLQNDSGGTIETKAHRELVTSLLDDGFHRVVLVLYGEAAPIGVLSALGDELSMRLSQWALERGEYPLAAQLAAQINKLPEGLTETLWQLQVARLEVFAGNSKAGSDRLLRILNQSEEIKERELDQLLQVAFDLQAISQHDLALAVFKAAGPFANTTRQRRELFFWMGESQIGKLHFAQGADLFLQSAEVGNQHLDLWGQSARFRAAEALVEAGLLGDAYNVYRSLLRESSDEMRRMQLRQKLQELRLLEALKPD